MKRKTIFYKYERKTFASKVHVIYTPKYKIYRVSQDVYSYTNEFIKHLDDILYSQILNAIKWPTPFYKKKADQLIESK